MRWYSSSQPRFDDEEADHQQAMELSLKDIEARNRGLARTMVIRETDSGRIQSLLEVQGKGKENIIDEQIAYTLLDLNTSKKKSTVDQFIIEMESDEVVTPVNKEKDASYRGITEINTGVQDEGQDRSNPEFTDASTQQNPKQIDEKFTITAYLNVQENLKLSTEDQLEQHMANVVQANLDLEERLTKQNSCLSELERYDLPTVINKHASRLCKLEHLNINHQVKIAVDEIVTDAVDWAMQASLQAHFSDLPTIDKKEILHQRMFKDNSYVVYLA
nr:hypothetical protein [Tanacetum cinerariifolium]